MPSPKLAWGAPALAVAVALVAQSCGLEVREPEEPSCPGGAARDDLVRKARYTWSGSPGPTFVEILDVEVVGPHVFLCTATQGMLIVDRTDPELPIQSFNTSALERPACQHVAVDGERVIITNRGHEYAPTPHVALFDASRVRDPIELSNVSSPTTSYEGAVALGGDLYAIGLHQEGVAIFDAGDKGVLSEVARVTGLTNAWDFAVDGNRLYVADGSGGVAVLDVADPHAAGLVGTVPLEGAVKHLEIAGGRLYASAGADGVHVLDLADRDAPSLVGTVDTPGSALMSAVTGPTLFVADWNDVRAYDVSDPERASLVAVENIAASKFSRVLALDAAGDRAYLGEWTGLYDYSFHPARKAPDLSLASFSLQFPEGDGPSAVSLVIENEGEEPLEITGIESSNAAFSPLAQTLTIEPGGNDFVELRFDASTTAPTIADLTITSNDPDECTVDVRLEANVGGLGIGDLMPSLEWVDLQSGDTLGLEALRGSVVVLSYFATF